MPSSTPGSDPSPSPSPDPSPTPAPSPGPSSGPTGNDDPWLPADPIPYNRQAVGVGVYRRTDQGWDLLDNLEIHWIDQKEGPDPGNALMTYRFGTGDPLAPPDPVAALTTGEPAYPKTVVEGDRIVVKATRPDSVEVYLFDGYAVDFGLEVGRDEREVTIFCQGRAAALWDTPMPGAYYRDASKQIGGDGYQTAIPARFDSKGVPNRVAAGGERTLPSGVKYPVFVDPLIAVSGDENYWKLYDAITYLIWHNNQDEEVVKNPTPDALKALLIGREPIDGTAFNPDDPSTYTAIDLYATDRPLSGRDMPTVVHEMIRDQGFGMCFDLTEDDNGDPTTTLALFLQYGGSIKDLWLQAPGSTLDLRYSNTTAATIKRQLRNLVNQWTVQGAPERYEASFVLAPMFPAQASDGMSLSSLKAYDRSNAAYTSTNRFAYRLYGVDETGDGHYAPGSSTKLTTVADFSAVFGSKDYAVRRRPAIKGGDLISSDSSGLAIKYELAYSTDHTGPTAAVWDRTGTWSPITRGFKVSTDRLGIEVTADNPNHWSVGEAATDGRAVVLKGVEDQCQVVAGKTFRLRLTVVIESDDCLSYTAPRRDASPLEFVISRIVDARDRLFLETIDKSSAFNSTGAVVVSRDDTDDAMAEAIQARATTEAGTLDGDIRIPYLTDHYQIGDSIRSIEGIGIGFQTGGGQEAPIYPVVVGRKWTLKDRQETTLYLSDESPGRHTLERKARR